MAQRFKADELAIVRDFMRQAKEVFQRQMSRRRPRPVQRRDRADATRPPVPTTDAAATADAGGSRRRESRLAWPVPGRDGGDHHVTALATRFARPGQGGPMPYVFDFDHTHPRPPMELKDLLGGKGANLAEMTSVLELPVPPGFTISTDACRAYMAGGWPKGLDAEVAAARTRLETAMGKTIGDAADPLLVSVRSGAKFSMPGMMDTVLNLGLNDDSVEGLAKQTGDERFAFDSYRRFIAMYARIVLELPGEEFDSLFDAAKELAGTTSDAKVPVELLRYLVDSYQQIVERHTGKPFPQKPAEQLRGAIEAVFRSWNGPRAIAYREREHIAHDLGTAVNVQAMVFGNRDDNSGTGVGLHPRPGDRGQGRLRRLPGQRAGRGRGGRHPQHRAHLGAEEAVPQGPRRAAQDLRPPRGALPGHVRHRVHHRAGQALDAPDPGGQAHRRRRPEDGGRHGAPERPRDLQGRGGVADHRGPPRLRPAPAVRRLGLRRLGQGPRRQPGRRGGPHLLHGRRRRRAAAERGEQVILVRNETSPEDVHGMLAVRGDPHRPRRPGQPRRGRGARAGASRPSSAPRSCAWATTR